MTKRRTSGRRTPRKRGFWTASRVWLTSGAVAGLVAIVAVFAIQASGSESSDSPESAGAGGEAATDLVLATAGGEVRLSELRGRPVLLYFSFPG